MRLLSDPETLTNKGEIFFDQGQYSDALKYYDKALAINPNYIYALINKGQIFSDQGNYSEAHLFHVYNRIQFFVSM